MLTLFVTGLEFYAYHGVPEAERLVGHRYIADLEMEVLTEAGTTDEFGDTVNYAEAAGVVLEVSASNRYKTLERLAQVIGETLLQKFPRIQTVSVRLAKRLPPAPIIAEELGVEVSLARPRA